MVAWMVTQELVVGQEFSGYRIERVVGRGGMGVVYLATDLRLRRPVALKAIAPEHFHDEDFRRRFQRESQLAASLDHPNVVPIFHAGEVAGQSFLTMRFVDGADLKSLIDREGAIAHESAVDIVAQAASGLDEAHRQGLVHRDVKPANLLIQDRDGRRHVYLTDFGLTKQMNADGTQMTATGAFVGTVDYVAPEQVNGEPLDARTDVYALGAVLHHALTGSVPFPGRSSMATLVAQLHEPPPSPCSLQSALPEEFDTVIAKAMAKDPGERYLSAGDLARAALAASRAQSVTRAERSVARGEAAGSLAAQAPTKLAEPARRPVSAPAPPAPPPPPFRPRGPAPPTPSPVGSQRPSPKLAWQWVLWPILSFGTLTVVGFRKASVFAGVPAWKAWGAGYSVVTTSSIAIGASLPESSQLGHALAAPFFLGWIGSCVHAALIRRKLGQLADKAPV
jgi:serine/threonine protein kinase